MGENLRQLVYRSRAARQFEPSDLEELLGQSRDNNRALGVTGLLLYHQGHFLQTLEGTTDAVEETFQRIKRDPRHRRVVVITDHRVSERSFPDWSMAFHGVDDPDALEGFSRFMTDGEVPEDTRPVVRAILDRFPRR